MLDLSRTRDLHLHADTFKILHKLRFLRFYNSKDSRSIYIPTELESFPNQLRYLEWSEYPLKSLPSTFCAKMLVELCMPRSNFSKLWDGVQDLANLKEINLEGCRQLVELPDFTKASNLKIIDLSWCDSLCCVHPSILCIHTLESLDLEFCKKLKILKGEIHLKSLEYLRLTGCLSLEEFSMSSKKITKLNLMSTNINMLHTSIGRLSRLKKLNLTNSRLQSLPSEFCFLTSLEELRLFGCKQVTQLPHNIKSLSRLTILGFRDCRGLQSLPELPPSVLFLDATNCISLHTVFGKSLQTLFNMEALFRSSMMIFSFKNCKKLDEHSLYRIMEDAHDTGVRTALCDLLLCGTGIYEEAGCEELNSKVWYPGSKVPEWFRYQTRQASITVELDQPNQILGFFICCVISQTPPRQVILPQYYLGDGEKDKCKQKLTRINVYRRLNSDHVCIWYDGRKQILDGIAKCRVDDHCTTYNQKISLEFITKSHKRIDRSDHLCKWHAERKQILDGMAKCRVDDHCTTCNQKISLECITKSHKRYEDEDEEDEGFYKDSDIEDEYGDGDETDEEEVKFGDWLVKGCGICPIYISDIQNFIQKVEMELEFNDDKFKEYRELVLDKFHSKNLEVVGESENASLKARNLIIDPAAIATSWKQNDAQGENT